MASWAFSVFSSAGASCFGVGTPFVLGDTSPFFPGILLFRKPEVSKRKSWFLKRRMAVQNGESTPRVAGALKGKPKGK